MLYVWAELDGTGTGTETAPRRMSRQFNVSFVFAWEEMLAAAAEAAAQKEEPEDRLRDGLSCNGKMTIYLLIYSNFVSFRFGVVWFISIFDCISFVLLSCPAIHSHEIKTYHLNFICIGKQQEDDRENEKERDGEMEGIPISWPNKSTWGPRVIVSPAEIVFIVAEIVA